MTSSFTTIGITTALIRPGDDIVLCIMDGIADSPAASFQDGDVLVVAESAVATAEGAVVRLDSVTPGQKSVLIARQYDMDPRLVEIVRSESDEIVGGIRGFLLCMKGGTLLPNAGVDASNAPPGYVVTLPRDPDCSAWGIRERIRESCGRDIGVIIADSRTHPMRVGCGGVAIGCAGIPSIVDARGRKDLFGHTLEVTRQALADNLASAAEIVMGEADECTPAAIIRGLGIPLSDQVGIEAIDAADCLFMGILRRAGD